MNKLAFPLVLAFALGACSQQGVEPAAPAKPQAAAPRTAPDQPAQETPPKSAAEMFGEKLDQVIAGAWREPANKARDPYRHPKQTLEFFGVKPGMTLIEITPGGGWYSEILAPLLNGNGHYIAAVMKPSRPDGEAANSIKALQAMFSGNAREYGAAKIEEFDPKAPDLGAPGSVDMVVTFRNVHNWVMADTAPLMFKAFFDVLKPGGILGVADHRAAAGADLEKIKNSGYLPQDYVIKLATDAGFKLAAQSEINANPKDTRDWPKGVWTLPPTLTLGDQDRARYLAIGESDRMTLRFVKPGSDEIFKQGADQKPASSGDPH